MSPVQDTSWQDIFKDSKAMSLADRAYSLTRHSILYFTHHLLYMEVIRKLAIKIDTEKEQTN